MNKASVVWIIIIAGIAGLSGCDKGEDVSALKIELAKANREIETYKVSIGNKNRELQIASYNHHKTLQDKKDLETKYQALSQQHNELQSKTNSLQQQYQTESTALYTTVEQQIIQYQETIAEQDAIIAQLQAVLMQYQNVDGGGGVVPEGAVYDSYEFINEEEFYTPDPLIPEEPTQLL